MKATTFFKILKLFGARSIVVSHAIAPATSGHRVIKTRRRF